MTEINTMEDILELNPETTTVEELFDVYRITIKN